MFEILSICKGGGYMYCKTNPVHPKANSNKLYPLHRVLMENKIGRILEKWEHVHHIDENKNNNTIENLEILTESDHAKRHNPSIPDVKSICPYCNKEFLETPCKYRLRKKRNKYGLVFCSRSCSSFWTSIKKAPN